MNRIQTAIERLENRLTSQSPEAVEKCNAAAVLDFDEWVAFNNARAFAQASGVLTSEESSTLAGIMGIGSPDTFKGATLAQRIVTMQACTELLGRQIAQRRSASAA